VGIREGLSRVSWKLSRTVLRGGAASNGGSLLDKKTATGKQPYAIALADRGIMALAGVWENWKSSADEWVRSFAIVTTEPNELCAQLHNRMPVVLPPARSVADMARRGAGRPDATQIFAGPVPFGRDDRMAGPRTRRKRQEQRSVADRADHLAVSGAAMRIMAADCTLSS
jgi:hypothetical protein